MSKTFTVQNQTGRIANGPDPLYGIFAWFRGTPTAGLAGFEPGCVAIDLTNGVAYWNSGTKTSAVWSVIQGYNTSGNITTVTAATLAAAAVAGQSTATYLLNRAAGIAVTLPAATGSGAIFVFDLIATVTSNTTTITAAGSDLFLGNVLIVKTSTGALSGFTADGATNHILTLNGTTTGGVIGDEVVLQDIAAGFWQINATLSGSGTIATPLS
jgi:hypothetical protein